MTEFASVGTLGPLFAVRPGKLSRSDTAGSVLWGRFALPINTQNKEG